MDLKKDDKIITNKKSLSINSPLRSPKKIKKKNFSLSRTITDNVINKAKVLNDDWPYSLSSSALLKARFQDSEAQLFSHMYTLLRVCALVMCTEMKRTRMFRSRNLNAIFKLLPHCRPSRKMAKRKKSRNLIWIWDAFRELEGGDGKEDQGALGREGARKDRRIKS